MNTEEMRERLLDEIKCIPDVRVAEVCDLLHFFRVGLEKAAPREGAAADLMSFAGSWSDMPEEQFASLAAEWRERRRELVEVLEEWILLKLQDHERVPVVNGIDLSMRKAVGA